MYTWTYEASEFLKLRGFELIYCLAIRFSIQNVSIQGEVILKSAIKMDYKKTGQCKMTIAARVSEGSGIGWGLAKNSPYLEKFNQG